MKPVLLLATATWLAGCAQIEPVHLPELPTAPAFKQGIPSDAAISPHWWKLYGDAELDQLQQQLLTSSPDLASALARYDQARAANAALSAAQSPTVGISGNVQRLRQSERRPLRVLGPTSPDEYNSATLGLDVGYELDLWGRVRERIAAGTAQARAAEADFAAARLTLQVQLADGWISLRGLDAELALLREAETSYQRATELIALRHQAGIVSGLDLARAQTQLDSTRSQLRQAQARRALLEHAVAALVGAHASVFTVEPRALSMSLPSVPAGLPSTLLERRPDIAAAQDRVVAATASVGVARTAFYPSVTLGGQIGLQSSDVARFIDAPNIFWALGSSVAMTLFDGGRRRADVAHAEAILDEAGHRYRAVVLGAFQQVEDQLALLDRYAAAMADERSATAAAGRAQALATHRWRDGAASYLEVVTAQTTHLQARRSELDLRTRQLRASVQLVRALGGGWSGPAPSGAG